MKRDNTVSHDLRIDSLSARSSGKIFGLATELSGRNAGGVLLFALEHNRLLWYAAAPSPEQNGSPLAIGPSTLYESAQDGALYAFARADGKQLWKYQVGQGRLSAPTVGADGTIYLTGPNHNLHAVATDGQQRWMVSMQNQ